MPNDTADDTADASRPDADANANGIDAAAVDPRIERTRAAVAAAAGALLLQEGPDAITHARVAAAADVSRTTVYKHWPERSDLLRSTLSEIGKQAPIAGFRGELHHDLRLMLGQLADDLNDEAHSRVLITMLERAQHDPTVDGVRGMVFGEFHDAFSTLVAGAIDRGELRPDIDTGRALATLGGPLLFRRFLAGKPIDDRFVDEVIDAFVEAHAS